MLPGFDSAPLKREFAKLLQRIGPSLRLSGFLTTGDITLSGAKINFAKGADIVSAATVNLATATGNSVNLTGTTPVTAWTMLTGQSMRVNFTAATPITYNATTNRIQGGSSITGESGSYMTVYYDGTTTFVDYNLGNGAAASGPCYTTVPAAITATGATLTANAVGVPTKINSATATTTNLMAVSALLTGQTVRLTNIGAGIATFNRVGSDTITGCNLVAATSISLNQGETVELTCDSASTLLVTDSNVNFFGPPRTWQAVTRTAGASNPNNTGRSISVNCTLTSTTTATATCVITQNAVSTTIRGTAGLTGSGLSVYAEIPKDAAYVLTTDAGTPTVALTAECR